MTQVRRFSESRTEHADKGLAVASVYYALFRVVEVAEYAGSNEAVEWARGAVEDCDLLDGFVERVREVPYEGTARAARPLAGGGSRNE
jgi:hypothetical protein